MNETNAADCLAFRPFAERDFEPLSELMAETWLADCPARAASVAAQVELCEYAAETTWGCVCERPSDNTLLGAILIAEKDQEATGAESWSARGDELLVEAEGNVTIAEAIRAEMGVVREEESLAAEYCASGEPESEAAIKLLIVSAAARGMGLGRKLVDAARAHLRECGAQGFYLLTDDSCDVSFYDHMGLRRAMSRRLAPPSQGQGEACTSEGFSIYVYAERL